MSSHALYGLVALAFACKGGPKTLTTLMRFFRKRLHCPKEHTCTLHRGNYLIAIHKVLSQRLQVKEEEEKEDRKGKREDK